MSLGASANHPKVGGAPKEWACGRECGILAAMQFRVEVEEDGRWIAEEKGVDVQHVVRTPVNSQRSEGRPRLRTLFLAVGQPHFSEIV
jgi:hypothetical protein